jgi:Second Messenger Oligonucleotide or Dinucleotide Synthetase domain
MTLTTTQAFDWFEDKISPTADQRADITAKHNKTEQYLRQAFPKSGDLPLKRLILIGSVDRGTIVRPVNDIDVMAEFTNKDDIFEQYRYKSGEFLQRIRRGLNAETQIKQIGARGQAVRLFYTTGAHVDIAPTFKWAGSGYALPNGQGGWLTTDPEAQAQWYSHRRQSVGTNLTPVVKLARRWNAVHSHHFQSYHLEVMVASMFSAVGGNHRDALKCFFDWAPRYISVSDPAGHSGTLDAYLTQPARIAISARLGSALDRAKLAQAADAKGDHAEAKRLWRIELGDEFPTG